MSIKKIYSNTKSPLKKTHHKIYLINVKDHTLLYVIKGEVQRDKFSFKFWIGDFEQGAS